MWNTRTGKCGNSGAAGLEARVTKMTTIPEAVELGLAHHRAGQLQQAETIYRQVLQANPQHAGAAHLWGLVALQVGRYDLAVERISVAVRLDGRQAAFHVNLGAAYRGMGRLAEAQQSYEQALRLQPDLAEAQNNLGTMLQSQGKLPEAIALYQKAIAKNANYADAHNNLGTAIQEQGNWPQAIACYRKAVEVEPRYARGFYNLGVALAHEKQLDESRAAFEQAVALEKEYTEAHYGLALVLHEQRKWPEAETAYREALRLRPNMAEAACSLGTLYQGQNKLEPAIEMYQEALRHAPAHAEAYYNWGTALKRQQRVAEAAEKYRQAIRCKPTMADAHYNLGTVLQELGDREQAAQAYREAIRLRPEMALAHNNLGNIYKQQGNTAEAIACYEQAVGIHPEQAEALMNLGSVLQQQGQLPETVACYQKALRSKPDSAEAYSNLGAVLQEQGKAARALACYQASLRLRPDFPEAHYNLALLYLSQEKFAEAWPEYVWRLKCQHFRARVFGKPLWDGSPLAGRTLLVHAEQGLGDTMMFVRFLSAVRKLGGRVLLESQPSLVPLLKASGIDDVYAAGDELPPYDVYLPLLNSPSVLGVTRESLAGASPYLTADSGLVRRWSDKLSAREGFRVGIAWQGNPEYAFDRMRSIPLGQFAPLAEVAGARLISLQKSAAEQSRTGQVAPVAAGFTMEDLGPGLDEAAGAFMDTAAVMKNLDLVVTSDTATAHLAGALSVPVWVALCASPDWRWFVEREDSPWYPTMRLFRQQTAGDWSVPFRAMARQLTALVGAYGA